MRLIIRVLPVLLLLLGARLPAAPIHVAARAGDAAAVQAQLAADPTQRDARDDQQQTPLHSAAAAGQLAVVTLLLERGADINAADALGMTPLHLALVSSPAPGSQICNPPVLGPRICNPPLLGAPALTPTANQ